MELKTRKPRIKTKVHKFVVGTKLHKLETVNIVKEHNINREVSRENSRFIKSLTCSKNWGAFVSIGAE
jgi:hypothetical protein